MPKGTPGARRVKSKSSTYFVKIRGTRYPLETTDLQTAWQKLTALQKRLREEELGISTPAQAQAVRPLAEHLEEFCAHVLSKGTSAKEVRDTRGQIVRLCSLAGWKRLADIGKDSCLVALGKVLTELKRSQQTRNHYLRRMKAFTAWLADAEPPRLPRDPLRQLRKIRVTEKRHARRIPTDAEVQLLMMAIDRPEARRRRKMSGPQRALGYRVSMATGFRANELRCLTRACFDLDAGIVRLPARSDKRRQGAAQPLPPWLVAELRVWFDGGGGTWQGFPEWAGRLLQADLLVAGVPYTIEGPEYLLYLDFHSLRKWFVNWAAHHPGISPKLLHDLVRHSTPQLTLSLYAEAHSEEQQRTLADLPDLSPKKPPEKTSE